MSTTHQNHFVAAIIYARFSKLAQGQGSSIARQLTDCRAMCDRMGWTVEAELIDRGLSAFTKKNREATADFGRFEAEALAGLHVGKVLVVERLDRLSRAEPEEGYDLLRALTKAGVTVATVDGGEIYEAGKPIPFEKVMMLFMKFHVANEESVKKSDRVRKGKAEARRKARDEGRSVTKGHHAWIKIVDGERVAIDARAATIREIFRLVDEEGLGKMRIVRRLHEMGVKPWGQGKRASQGWHESYIGRLLTNRAVIGEFQPHKFVDGVRVADGEPIPGYFPAIVDADVFARVSAGAVIRKQQMGGRKDEKVANLVSGLIQCGCCGGTMRYRAKRPEGAQVIVNGKTYTKRHADASLICSNAERGNGGCANRVTLAYHTFEKALLDSCLHLALDDDAFANRGEAARLVTTIAERRNALNMAEKRAERLWSAWADEGAESARKLAQEAEAATGELRANVEALERQLGEARGRVDSEAHLRRVGDVRARLYDADLAARVPLRRKVTQALCTLFSHMIFDGERVIIYFKGAVAFAHIDRKGNVTAHDLASKADERAHPAFMRRRAAAIGTNGSAFKRAK